METLFIKRNEQYVPATTEYQIINASKYERFNKYKRENLVKKFFEANTKSDRGWYIEECDPCKFRMSASGMETVLIMTYEKGKFTTIQPVIKSMSLFADATPLIMRLNVATIIVETIKDNRGEFEKMQTAVTSLYHEELAHHINTHQQ
jgi:hypothetical protein